MKLQQRLQQQLNKSIIIFLIVCLSFFNINDALAANTHSIDLELSSSQYLSIADASQTGLDLIGDLTFGVWVKLESAPTSGNLVGLISKWLATTDKSYSFYYYNNSGTYQLVFVNSDDGSAAGSASINQTLTVGTWTHIIVTYDASAGQIEIFINGSSIGTATGTLKTSIYNGAAIFAIGFTPNVYFDGLIDEVRVYNDIRTPTEISTNYQQEIPADTQGLVGYWKLNNSLLDETANNNDLTNNNSAVFSSSVPFTGAVEFIPQILIY